MCENCKEQFKNIHYRLLENKYPKKDEIVYGKIVKKEENGFYVSLLEYDNIEGFLKFKEISKNKAIKYPASLLNEGSNLSVLVLKVDEEKGFIDLSKKQVKPDQEEKCKKNFAKSKSIENIIKILCIKTKKTMEFFYKNLIWPLFKKFDHAYDAFLSIFEGDYSFLENLDKSISDEIKKELIKQIKKRIIPETFKIRSIFSITCFNFNGIEDIKESLSKAENKRTQYIPFKFKIIASPLYECSVNTINKEKGIKIINEALKDVKKNIEEKGGYFYLTEKPHVFNEREKSIIEQMKEALDNLDKKLIANEVMEKKEEEEYDFVNYEYDYLER